MEILYIHNFSHAALNFLSSLLLMILNTQKNYIFFNNSDCWNWTKCNSIGVTFLLSVQGEDHMCSVALGVALCLAESSQSSFCTEGQNSCQSHPLGRPVGHSGTMNLLHVGTAVTPEPAGWTGGHLEFWVKFHCVSENLNSSFKDCEDLREFAWLESNSSLERKWSKFVINWCQIWHCKVQAFISVFLRQVSTFHSPHAYWFTELFCMSVCAL